MAVTKDSLLFSRQSPYNLWGEPKKLKVARVPWETQGVLMKNPPTPWGQKACESYGSGVYPPVSPRGGRKTVAARRPVWAPLTVDPTVNEDHNACAA